MGNATYIVINDEEELVRRIEDLEKIAKEYIRQTEDLHYEDLYFLAAIDKSLKLIDSFLFALSERNITVLAVLTRLQMDCCLRTFAVTLVPNSGEFCCEILSGKTQMNKMKDQHNNSMTDKHLCNEFGKVIKLPIYDLYSKISGFVHFSDKSFHNNTSATGNGCISIEISRKNNQEKNETYKKLSLELANHFYYFGRTLIEVIYGSWMKQKKPS